MHNRVVLIFNRRCVNELSMNESRLGNSAHLNDQFFYCHLYLRNITGEEGLFWTELVLDISIEYVLSCLHQHERLHR